MDVLISGSEGFIGLNLVKSLLKKKINVVGIGRGKKKSSINYKYFKYDLLNKKKFPKKLKKNYDVIVHAAGLTSHSDIVNNKNFTKNSLKISKKIYQLFSKTNSKHLIFLSSGKVYKNNNLSKYLNDEDKLYDAMIKYPKIKERPIVIEGDKAIIGRPPENIYTLIK